MSTLFRSGPSAFSECFSKSLFFIWLVLTNMGITTVGKEMYIKRNVVWLSACSVVDFLNNRNFENIVTSWEIFFFTLSEWMVGYLLHLSYRFAAAVQGVSKFGSTWEISKIQLASNSSRAYCTSSKGGAKTEKGV